MKHLTRMSAGFYILISIFSLLYLGGCVNIGGSDGGDQINHDERAGRTADSHPEEHMGGYMGGGY